MKNIHDIINLGTHSNDKQLVFNSRYLVQTNFTFDVAVVSSDFSGKSHFCVNKSDIVLLIDALSDMHLNLIGTSRLNDTDSDGYIEFSMGSLGDLTVSGQIGGSHEKQSLRFNFITDQTVLPKFIADLTSINQYEDL